MTATRTESPEVKLLDRDREVAERVLPGAQAALAEHALMDLEQRGSPAIAAFREFGGPGLLVPREYGGAGASLLDAVRVQRVIGSLSPSLAIGTTMHHISIAGFVEVLRATADPDAPEWELVRQVATQPLIVASGSAEGITGQSVLRPTVEARRSGDNFLVAGSKKPCSLSASMDIFSASVVLRSDDPEEDGQTAMAIVFAGTPGIERRPFWETPILGGAESDEVVLEDVEIPQDLIVLTGENGGMDRSQAITFLWFELLATACYLGAASALVERALATGKGEPMQVAGMLTDVESAMAAVEGVAATAGEQPTEADLVRSLHARYCGQEHGERAAATAVEVMGGLRFIRDPETAYLLAATHALGFHPPPRARIAQAIVDHVHGKPFRTGDF
jgi:alkylation response protein AidB-like acyl-CoA dehydrogenase